jgi:hypothetical protein
VSPPASIKGLETLVLTNNKIAELRVRCASVTRTPQTHAPARSTAATHSSVVHVCLTAALRRVVCRVLLQDLGPLSSFPRLSTLILLGNPVALKREYR